MRSETLARSHVEREVEVAIYGDGVTDHPTHSVQVRNWRASMTLDVRTPGGWVGLPIDPVSARRIADALYSVAGDVDGSHKRNGSALLQVLHVLEHLAAPQPSWVVSLTDYVRGQALDIPGAPEMP